MSSSIHLAGACLMLFAATVVLANGDPKIHDWSTPVATVGGGCPIESRDGGYLYTASASAGTLDIWVYRRDVYRHGFEFVDRTLLGPPVSLPDAGDFCPTPIMGDWLMFVSTRDGPGTCGAADLFLAEYHADPPASAGDALRLGCAPDGPNTAGTEFSPSLITTLDGIFLYYSSDGGGNQDILVSEMAPDGTFGPGTPVAELNTSAGDQQPNVSRDGLTIVFASNRDGGVMDIYMATRGSVNDAWSKPVNLSHELHFPTQGVAETRPSLSWDGERLYYGADGIVYVSERARKGRPDRDDDHRPGRPPHSWFSFLFYQHQ